MNRIFSIHDKLTELKNDAGIQNKIIILKIYRQANVELYGLNKS